MRRSILIILGVIAVAGFAFGCGSGEEEATSKGEATAQSEATQNETTSEDETTSAPLTKKEFIKQANAICVESAKQLEADVSAWMKEYPGGPAAARKNIDEAVQEIAVPAVRRKAEELGSLVPPAEDQAEISQILENLEKVSRIYEKEGEKSLIGPDSEQVGEEMEDYGLSRCTVL
jgi:hypothetical protein